MMTCAPFMKSPNWASHITRAWCSATEYPNSKPITAASERSESNTSKRAPPAATAFRGTCSSPVRTSESTAWRWEKVPRPESCPERRTGMPSRRRVPQARDSAVAQSTSPLPLEKLGPSPHEGQELGVDLEAVGKRAEGLQDGAEPPEHRRLVHRRPASTGVASGDLREGLGGRLLLRLHGRLLRRPTAARAPRR